MNLGPPEVDQWARSLQRGDKVRRAPGGQWWTVTYSLREHGIGIARVGPERTQTKRINVEDLPQAYAASTEGKQ